MPQQAGMQQGMQAVSRETGAGRSAPPVGFPYMDAGGGHGYGYVDAGAPSQQAQMLAHGVQQQSSMGQAIPLSASFESRPMSSHTSHVPYDPLGRSFDDVSKQQGIMSPHRINTRSSFNDSYQAPAPQRHAYSYGSDAYMMQQQQQQQRAPLAVNMRASADPGRTADPRDPNAFYHASGPSLRSSFDAASLRSTAPALSAPNNMMGTPPRNKAMDGDTSRVLAELERLVYRHTRGWPGLPLDFCLSLTSAYDLPNVWERLLFRLPHHALMPPSLDS